MKLLIALLTPVVSVPKFTLIKIERKELIIYFDESASSCNYNGGTSILINNGCILALGSLSKIFPVKVSEIFIIELITG